jgi:hypothetical protein
MKNKSTIRFFIGVVSVALGCAVFFVHTDQQFINLTPGEGQGLLEPMRKDVRYEQTFTSKGQTISKIGLYAVPIRTEAKSSSGVVSVELLLNNEVRSTAALPVSLIDNGGASLVRILQETSYGQSITIRATISPEADGMIALQKRPFDETFSKDTVRFTKNGSQQEYAIAYTVFEKIHPAFVQQLGGIFVILGLLLTALPYAARARSVTSLLLLSGVAILHAIPSLQQYPFFFLVVLLLLVTTWFFFRISGRTMMASFFGACIFAGSTWLPLLMVTGGNVTGMLSIRDALIDPNQISVSHGAGGYVGIPGALLASIGVLIWITMLIRKRYIATQLDTCMGVLFIISLCITFIPGVFHSYRAITLVVFCIAYFASLTLDAMQRFLGLRDTFAQTLILLLLAIFILDLMNITARTFAYGVGI